MQLVMACELRACQEMVLVQTAREMEHAEQHYLEMAQEHLTAKVLQSAESNTHHTIKLEQLLHT